MPHAGANDDDADVRQHRARLSRAHRSWTRAIPQEDAAGHPYRTPRRRIDGDIRQNPRVASVSANVVTSETPNAEANETPNAYTVNKYLNIYPCEMRSLFRRNEIYVCK